MIGTRNKLQHVLFVAVILSYEDLRDWQAIRPWNNAVEICSAQRHVV